MTQIKIKYVNEPKAGGSGKFGSLKDFDGVTYMVPARLLPSFTAGTMVDVELKAETWGTSQMQVVQGPPNGPATNGTNPVRLTPQETARVVSMQGYSPSVAQQGPQQGLGQQALGYERPQGGTADINTYASGMIQTRPNPDRMIFITGVTGRAMGSGTFTPEHIKIIAAAAAAAYDDIAK